MVDRALAVDAWESLFRAQHEVFELIRRDFEGSALTQPEYDVLLTVTRSSGMTARLRDVTEQMLISQPSVSRLVDRMVESGLVTKCADPEDGRGSLITATEHGARLFRTMGGAHARHVSELMSALDTPELESLKAITSKLRASLHRA
ncbi:MAG: MarR family transcriptional regulator [Microbacterium sp.]